MGFEQCHPAVNFIYFAAVIAGMALFRNPVFLLIGFLCGFAYSIRRNGKKALIFNLITLPLVAAFALYYGTYTHFGVTVLYRDLIGNSVTAEAILFGMVLGLTVAGVCIWFSCVYSVFTTDKVVYLFGTVSPRLSLFLAILLRMVPRIKGEARRINTAQKGIGRGANQGSLFQRLGNCFRILSMLITWTIEALTNASVSMQSRGSHLRGRKAFSIYRFDNRDRAYVLGMFCCLTLTLMAVILGQTDTQYDPYLLFPKISALSYFLLAGYALLCLMPLLLELWTAHRFRRARRGLY